MIGKLLVWGLVVGVVHFVLVGMLYGNPLVDRVYARAMEAEPGVRKWPSKPRYLVTQFLGTQVEVFLVTLAYIVLRMAVTTPGIAGAVVLGLLFTGIRVYPRFWNMWIQSTYPRRLLAIELVNGTLSTLAMTVTLEMIA